MISSKISSFRERLNRLRAEQHFQRALSDHASGIMRRDRLVMLPARLIMLAIFAVPILFLMAGLLCLWAITSTWVALIPAIFFLALAWGLVPKLPQFKSDALPISELPQFAQCLKEISDEIGVKPPDTVFFDASLNAGVYSRGGRSELTIGFNLWDACTDHEKTALLAHELAHLANSDPERGGLFHLALQSLEIWYQILTPDHEFYWDGSRVYGGLATQLLELFLWVVRLPIALTWKLLLRFLSSEQQRAEYFADAISVRVAGSVAVRGLLNKIVLIPLSLRARNHLYRASGTKLSVELVMPITDPDLKKSDKLMREMKNEESAIDASHPPTIYRLRFIDELKASETPLIPFGYAEIDQELSGVRLKAWDHWAQQMANDQELGVRYG